MAGVKTTDEIHTDYNRKKCKNPVELGRNITLYNETHLLHSNYCFDLRNMITSNLSSFSPKSPSVSLPNSLM